MNHLTGAEDAVISAASNSVLTPADIDSTWVLVTSFSAMLALLGFAFIGSGAVRYKSVQSAVITVFLGALVTLIFFWLVILISKQFGYGFAFGNDSGNKFIGFSRFAAAGYIVDDSRDDYTNFIFQSIGAIVVASLFGLGTLERSRFFSVSLCLMFLSGFLYPTALHWVQPTGWLKQFGFVDFAGGSYIHVFGGVTALVVSFFLKERRDSAGNVHQVHSPINIGYGSLLLAISLIIYISGANQEGGNSPYLQGLIACNALVAATFGALSSFFIQYLRTHKTSLIALSRGSVAGVVAVSAVVNHLRIWESALIGIFAGIIYIFLTLALHRSPVDDPAYTIATHFGPGLLGTLLVGVFSLDTGLLTGHGAKQFGIQIFGILAIIGWGLLVALFIIPLKGSGVFKINPFQESQGIDLTDGEAFTFLDHQLELLSGRIFQ